MPTAIRYERPMGPSARAVLICIVLALHFLHGNTHAASAASLPSAPLLAPKIPATILEQLVVAGNASTAGTEDAAERTATTTTTTTTPTLTNASSLTMSLVTWNFAEKCPSEKDAAFLKSYRSSDIVVVGVQECEDIKPRRHEGHRSRAWRALQKKIFGKAFKCVAQHKMGGLQIAVYGNQKACKLIQGMQVLDVACGVGNVLTNKGGICVLLRIKGQTLALINGHFAAHQTKVSERNSDFHRILSSITARAHPRWLVKALAQKRKRALRAKKVSPDPWLEQMFQAVGLPEDKVHADRQTAPTAGKAAQRRKNEGGQRSNTKKAAGVSGGKVTQGDSKHKGKGKSKSKRKEEGAAVFSLQSLLPDEVMGFKVKFGQEMGLKGPIIPTKWRDATPQQRGGHRLRESDDSDEEFTHKEDNLFSIDAFQDRLQPSFAQCELVPQSSTGSLSEIFLPGTRNVLPTLEDVPFDAIIFLGDLNYRLDLPRLEIEHFKEKTLGQNSDDITSSVGSRGNLLKAESDVSQLQQLLEYDQLGRERRLGKVFRGFSEGDIRFLPTFKYDKGTNKFDSSTKARCPAWTDRVLYAVPSLNGAVIEDNKAADKSDKPAKASTSSCMRLILSDYYSIDARHSDHRPVVAQLTLFF